MVCRGEPQKQQTSNPAYLLRVLTQVSHIKGLAEGKVCPFHDIKLIIPPLHCPTQTQQQKHYRVQKKEDNMTKR